MEYLNVRTMERSKGLQPSDLAPQATKPQSIDVHDQGYTMSQETSFSVEENTILQTTNYDIFTLDRLNRAIRQDKLDRLYDAVKEKNLLHLFPIIVNRSFAVMDGQHRLRVAQTLGVPIYYIVSSQMGITDAARANLNVSNWKNTDYLEHWCKVGLPDYITFRDFLAANQFMTITTAINLFAHGSPDFHTKRDGMSMTAIFNSGQFQASNITHAIKVAGAVRDFSKWVPFWKSSSFIHALGTLIENPDYDHRRMMEKMEYLSVRLVKCASLDDYLKVFEDIFNHKVHQKNMVHFTRLYKGQQRTKSSSIKD